MSPAAARATRLCAFALSALVLFPRPLFPDESMTITAKSGALQQFGGFGMHPGLVVGGGCKDDVNRLIVKDLNLQFIRFYAHGNNVGEIKNDFNANARGQINDFLAQNPDLFFCVGSSETVDKVEKIQPSCTKWAQFAKWVRDTVKLNVKWSSITSEPNADQWWELGYPEHSVFDRRIPLALHPEVVKAHRAAFDALGLEDIKMYAPETGSVDSISHEYVKVLEADSAAWNSVGGFFTKTYNMGADDFMKEIVGQTGRPYFGACGANLKNWYTNEISNDNDHYAAEMSGRIFNDFNHMISYRAWYLPAQIWTDREAAHRLIWLQGAPGSIQRTQVSSDCSVPISLKFWYLRHIAQTFDVGCRFRYCLSDPPRPYEDMWWTFGQKPAVSASVARNPDESWTIGIVNMAGCTSDTLPVDSAHPAILWTFYPAATYNVTVKVEELVGNKSLDFALFRSSKSQHMEFEDTVTMADGEVTVTLQPKELVTLRGAQGAAVAVKSMPGRTIGFAAGRLPFLRADNTLVVPFAGAGEYSVKLMNLAGRRLIGRHGIRCEGPGEWTFPAAECGAGVLLLQVQDKNGKGYATRVLVR